MAREINKLTARGVQPGRHSDGSGLYLVVESKSAPDGSTHVSKRWAFIYRRKRDGRQSEGWGSGA